MKTRDIPAALAALLLAGFAHAAEPAVTKALMQGFTGLTSANLEHLPKPCQEVAREVEIVAWEIHGKRQRDWNKRFVDGKPKDQQSPRVIRTNADEIMALFCAESGGDISAKSEKDARGLAQLMPEVYNKAKYKGLRPLQNTRHNAYIGMDHFYGMQENILKQMYQRDKPRLGGMTFGRYASNPSVLRAAYDKTIESYNRGNAGVRIGAPIPGGQTIALVERSRGYLKDLEPVAPQVALRP